MIYTSIHQVNELKINEELVNGHRLIKIQGQSCFVSQGIPFEINIFPGSTDVEINVSGYCNVNENL
jgi:hypothetical protein